MTFFIKKSKVNLKYNDPTLKIQNNRNASNKLVQESISNKNFQQSLSIKMGLKNKILGDFMSAKSFSSEKFNKSRPGTSSGKDAIKKLLTSSSSSRILTTDGSKTSKISSSKNSNSSLTKSTSLKKTNINNTYSSMYKYTNEKSESKLTNFLQINNCNNASNNNNYTKSNDEKSNKICNEKIKNRYVDNNKNEEKQPTNQSSKGKFDIPKPKIQTDEKIFYEKQLMNFSNFKIGKENENRTAQKFQITNNNNVNSNKLNLKKNNSGNEKESTKSDNKKSISKISNSSSQYNTSENNNIKDSQNNSNSLKISKLEDSGVKAKGKVTYNDNKSKNLKYKNSNNSNNISKNLIPFSGTLQKDNPNFKFIKSESIKAIKNEFNKNKTNELNIDLNNKDINSEIVVVNKNSKSSEKIKSNSQSINKNITNGNNNTNNINNKLKSPQHYTNNKSIELNKELLVSYSNLISSRKSGTASVSGNGTSHEKNQIDSKEPVVINLNLNNFKSASIKNMIKTPGLIASRNSSKTSPNKNYNSNLEEKSNTEDKNKIKLNDELLNQGVLKYFKQGNKSKNEEEIYSLINNKKNNYNKL